MADIQPILQIQNLHTNFHSKRGVVRAVDGVDLSLQRDEILGIVGESGSGKSVMSLSIMRLLGGTSAKIDEGRILFNGTDLASLDNEKMHHIRGNDIAMIFQDPMTCLNPVMKIGEQIIESIRLHQKVSKREARKLALLMLEKVRMPRAARMMDEYPFQLSGGQQQRVMIAMGLVCNPRILIADEPTTALDVSIQAQILELMNQLKTEFGMSILFITHDLGVVASLCDRVAVMYCGRIVEQGSIGDLFADPSNPYTLGLLNSRPRLGMPVDELETIPGGVPNPRHMPKGCKFEPRCKYAKDICRKEEPSFYEISPGHYSKCFRHEKDWQ
ncbi:ABC transporter ATP-binding protein [Lachnospiraceae bacterium ZAX-1]